MASTRPWWQQALAISFGAIALGSATRGGAEEPPAAPDPPSCSTVRISDIGWTDVTTTTAVFARLLTNLGYSAKVTVLSVPVTFASMKNKDIDVFLGNWMPAETADRKPYEDDGSVEVLGANLVGARYTLAVPDYTYQAGLRDFGDIHRFGAALKHSIYGIEPGNDGNRLVLTMVKNNQFSLADFKLIESSEQGMLAEVERHFAAHEPMVFLAWDPHPMNMRFNIRYLNGGDDVFGPNFGGATVYTNVRRGYVQECPNVGRLLKNLKFTTAIESEIMSGILDRHEAPDVAAGNWMKSHPAIVAGWVAGVTLRDGRMPPIGTHADRPASAGAGFESWITTHKLPVGDRVATGIEFTKLHGRAFFNAISVAIAGTVDGLTRALLTIPSLFLLIGMSVLAFVLRRSVPLAIFVALALLFILNQGYWVATMETLSLVVISTLVATAIGIPLGILAAHHPRFYAALRPVLDLMQTLPTFVYLIPTLVLFGLGVVPGLISTVIFALPAPIRLTQLGISNVPTALREAGEAFGATPSQLLWKVELPSAKKSILAGVTQCIMLSLSMVVIAALVGAGGLGVPVVRALNSVQIGMGFEAGITIVLLAIVIDRITRPAEGNA